MVNVVGKERIVNIRKGAAQLNTEDISVLLGTRNIASQDITSCRIISVGKRRDGGTRYWCLEHKADATAKYGRPADACLDANVPPIPARETTKIDLDMYGGGIALWGAVPPVYDTTSLPMDRGIHVHARQFSGGRKRIDRTYRSVRIIGGSLPSDGIDISEIDAIYFMVSSIFAFETKHIACTHCGYSHLDKDYFSIHPHRRHLCAGCGKIFNDIDISIGNPIAAVRSACGISARTPKSAGRALDLKQSDYKGGIQIWGTNPALIWTGEAEEEEGIHVHAYKGSTYHPEVDDTYSEVTIDGIRLDPVQIRILMAQQTLPSLRGRITTLRCESCEIDHFSVGTEAFSPSAFHNCADCGISLPLVGRKRKVVSNPLLVGLTNLAGFAVSQPRTHDLNLRPETL